THFLTVRFGLRLDSHRDHRLRECGWFEHNLEILIAQGVTGGDISNTDQSRDISRVSRLNVNSLVGLNHQDTADTLTFARARIVNDIAFLELAAVNAEKHQLADVRIGPKFESEGTELRIIIRSHFDLLQAIGCDAL